MFVRQSRLYSVLSLGACSMALSPASAQDPAGLAAQAPATSGTTEVAKGGFEAAAQPAESKDSTTFKVTAGGILSQGNSRTLAATAAADYFLRRSASQFSAQAAVNYGRSAIGPDEPMEKTVENYQAKVRYDHFLSGALAAFLSVTGRRDYFQGLDLRLNVDPGIAYYFIDEKANRLWAELGYDLQYDVRNQDAIDAAAAAGEEVTDTEVRHNVRAFVGYDNQLSDAVKFNTGLEYLQNVQAAENARINFDAGLTSQLSSRFSSAATLAVRYDNNPLPDIEKTDVITALNLVYTMAD